MTTTGTPWRVGGHTRLPPTDARRFEGGRRLEGGVVRHDPDLPLVSVITVVYNNAATLERCIAAVRAQGWPNIDYVVIDGGSTDGTLEIIKANLDIIDYAVSEPDAGIYDAMNKGIGVAQGDFIALINSDDWLEPDGIALSLDNIRRHGAEVSLGHVNVWTRSNTFSHVWQVEGYDARILTGGMRLCHQGVVASRRAYDTVGPFDTGLRISSDYKWMKGLYRSGLPAVVTRTPVANFSFDGVSANNRPVWKEECKRMLCDQYPMLAYDDVSAFLEYVYRDAGLDSHAAANLIAQAAPDPQLAQSLSLVLLDKLGLRETGAMNVVAPVHRVPLAPGTRGAMDPAADAAPCISVVIPIYGVEDYLEACLHSVMVQDFRDIEIICVNDGSPDKSQDIVDRLAATDPRIRSIIKTNGGLSSARNAGMRAARGEYVHFLDSDDHIEQGMYSALYAHARAHRLELVKSNLGYHDDVVPVRRPILPPQEVFTFADCPAYAHFISPCAALYHRDLLGRVAPFPEGLTYEDRPFNWETIIEARRIGHVDAAFYRYRLGRPGSLMTDRTATSKHRDAFVAMDLVGDILADRDLLETFQSDYIVEQIRLFAMLVDTAAIPRRDYGAFYWECHTRLNARPLGAAQIRAMNLPFRLRCLHKFFLAGYSGHEHDEGERYFFQGLDYASRPRTFGASACEMMLVARHWIDARHPPDAPYDAVRFRRAALITTTFDAVHRGVARIGSLRDLLDRLARLDAALDADPACTAFVTDLLALDAPDPQTVDHLCFQFIPSRNYTAAAAFVGDYVRDRGINALLIQGTEVSIEGLPASLQAGHDACAALIAEQGFTPGGFTEQVAMHVHVTQRVALDRLQTLTVLFPYSAAERYLIERTRGRVRSIFVPHGLPQVSFFGDAFDTVLAIANGPEWDACFAPATVVRLGWPEAPAAPPSADPVPLPAPGTAPVAGPVRKHRSVVFLSQIAGAGVHRMADFVLVTEAFLRAVVTMDPQRYRFNIRLRHQNEMAELNPTLLNAVRAKGHTVFTTMHSDAMTDLDPDVLVSATSTGLLYAQHFGVQAIQLSSPRLQQHWPYQLADDDFMLDYTQAAGALPDLIDRAIAAPMGRLLYQSPTPAERFAVLDRIYG